MRLAEKIIELTSDGYIVDFHKAEYGGLIEVRLYKRIGDITYARNHIYGNDFRYIKLGLTDEDVICNALNVLQSDLERTYNAQICP